ncbi:MAG: ABC transporter permease [Candidatus Heimdallarchaeota archaeon]|nr:ABC transporter permease [Candidatus Heimdallarchaeota archaeon]
MNVTYLVNQEFYELRNNIRFEFLKNLRHGKFRTLFLIPFVMAELFYLVPLLSGGDFPDNSLTFIADVMGFVSFIFVLFAMFLGADAINREHAQKTDLLIFPLPQRRSNVIIAKYITQLLTAWFGIVVFFGTLSINIGLVYGLSEIPAEIITSALVSMVYMSTVLAFAFFLSSIMKSTASSMTLTFFGVMILLPLLNNLLGIANIDLYWLFTNYSGLVTDVLQIQASSAGPFGGSAEVDFGEGIVNLLIQTMVFVLSFIYFGVKKEVGS